MYRSLRTNLPAPLMAFRDHPFPGTGKGSSFPTHEEVQGYLLSYRDAFGLQPLTRAGTTVTDVAFSAEPSCFPSLPAVAVTVATANSPPTTELFDLCVIATGHYAAPSIPPSLLPLAAAFPGSFHSVRYDSPAPLAGRTVLIVGGRASGSDIAREISPHARKVYVSDPTPPAVEVDAVIPSSTRGAGERSGLRFNYSRRPRGENGLPEYNAELPLFRVLFSWKGTILPLVLTRVSFWIMWGSHGVLILLVKAGAFNSDDDDDEPEDSFALTQPSWAAIGVPTSLTVFFLVSDRRLNV